VRLVFAGTPAAALPALDALLGSGHELVAVLTRPDAPAGRGRRLTASPVAERARAAGVRTLTPPPPAGAEFLDLLRSLAPDCCPVVAYGALVPPPALAIPPAGWVNLHFSLLPAWRGAAPVQHALLAGDDVTGATTFRLEQGLDTGPVFGVVTEPVRPTDTTGDLLARLAESGAQLLLATLEGIESGRLAAVPQPAEGMSLAPKLTPEDVRIDWSAPAGRVDRLVRAATPAPGAWTTLRGRRLKVLGSLGGPAPGDLRPGGLSVGPAGVAVGTATGALLLGRVQPEGKPAMAAPDWARGLRLGDADLLV